jgi:hypothetical protein
MVELVERRFYLRCRRRTKLNLDKEVGQWECLEYGKVASVFIKKAEETV